VHGLSNPCTPPTRSVTDLHDARADLGSGRPSPLRKELRGGGK